MQALPAPEGSPPSDMESNSAIENRANEATTTSATASMTTISTSTTNKKVQQAAKREQDDNPKARQITRGWTVEEDHILALLVRQEPNVSNISWNLLAIKMGCRSGKQCRERYINVNPDRIKGQWTEAEDEIIFRLQMTMGNQWSKIAADMPGRSDNDVKNRWHSKHRSTLKRKAVGETKNGGDKPRKYALPVQKKTPNESTAQPVMRRSEPTATVNNTRPHQQLPKRSNINVLATGPRVGQRVKVKFDEGQIYGGSITHMLPRTVSPQADSVQPQAYDITILYDDGISEDSIFPDPDVQLIPMKNKLTEREDTLCNELLNLHSTLKEPDAHEDYLFEHIATIAPKKGSSKGSHTTGAGKTVDLEKLVSNFVHTAPTVQLSALKTTVKLSALEVLPTTPASDSSSGSLTADSQRAAIKKKCFSNWPLSGPKPGYNDCLLGRGGGTNFHPGNIKYRTFIEDNKAAYRAASRTAKSHMSLKLVLDWRSQEPPGRFLRVNEKTGLWADVGNDEARIKCSQALREKKVSKLAFDPEVFADRAANSVARHADTLKTSKLAFDPKVFADQTANSVARQAGRFLEDYHCASPNTNQSHN